MLMDNKKQDFSGQIKLMQPAKTLMNNVVFIFVLF